MANELSRAKVDQLEKTCMFYFILSNFFSPLETFRNLGFLKFPTIPRAANLFQVSLLFN